MRTLHSESVPASGDLSPDQLERRLLRERRARKAVEALLEDRSRELYQANAALQNTAKSLDSQRVQLNTILDHTLAGIFLARDDMRISRANKSAKAMFALGDEDLEDMIVFDLFEHGDDIRDTMQDLLDTGWSIDDAMREAKGRRADGTTFAMEFGLANMDHQGERQSVWIFRDITRRKLVESRRATLEKERSQAQKLEALGTLASGVAHEINTHIQYVGDNIRFLQESFADLADLIAQYQVMLNVVEKAGDTSASIRATREKEREIDLDFVVNEIPQSIEQSLQGMTQVASIVNAIKEFSHPGEDEKVALDINKAIQTILTVTRNQWKNVADTDLSLADNLPAVRCLPGDINQVLLNLIVNAAHAIEAREDGAHGLISVQTRRKGNAAEIRISDTGCGIADKHKDQIFDPFFTTKEVGKGTGQGLSIAYRIITVKHGGTICLDTEVGKGTTFTIKLPIQDPNREIMEAS